MDYEKKKLRKKIKFYREEDSLPKMESGDAKEVKLEPKVEELRKSKDNLKEGLNFYKENMDMPRGKTILKKKRDRYLKALETLKDK